MIKRYDFAPWRNETPNSNGSGYTMVSGLAEKETKDGEWCRHVDVKSIGQQTEDLQSHIDKAIEALEIIEVENRGMCIKEALRILKGN